MEERKFELEAIPFNLQQGIIRAKFNDISEEVQAGVTNQVVAIYSYHLKLLLIAIEWRSDSIAIKDACPMEQFEIKYADHFRVDSWDKKFDNYPFTCPYCNETDQKDNYCSNCGEGL